MYVLWFLYFRGYLGIYFEYEGSRIKLIKYFIFSGSGVRVFFFKVDEILRESE